jgi:DNA polymerase-3 subunit delta
VKVDPRRVAGFLRDPGGCGVVLLYGDDTGLIRERAQALIRLVAGSTDDPFRVADLDRGEADRLVEEASALSLVGGRRAVRLRDATDACTGAVQAVLAGGLPALVVIEATGLTARSRLRQAVERAEGGAAIGCYPESGQGLEQLVRAHLTELGVAIEADALAWAASRLGADRGSTRQELDKLALYAGAGGRVDLEAAMVCLGDLSGLSLEDALYAATDGDAALTDRALTLALAEGGTPVGALRSALMHMQRLHRVCLLVESGGMSADAAVKTLRPPVFFRRATLLARAAASWRLPAIERCLRQLAAAEAACKRTGAPADTICRHAIVSMARLSR